jgi:hypothetical protein
VKFEIAERHDVLRVPTAALRWKPQPNQVVADAREAFTKSSHHHEAGGGGPRDSAETAASSSSASQSSPAQAPEGQPAAGEGPKGAPDAATKESPNSKDGQVGEKKGDGHGRTPHGDRGSKKTGVAGDIHKRSGSRRDKPTVWVDEDGFARPIQLETGVTDGTLVEIVGGDLKEGTQVIVGEVRHDEVAQTKNPFLPSMFRGGSRPKDKDK